MPIDKLDFFAVKVKAKEIAQFIVQSQQTGNPKRAIQFVVRVVYKELRKAGFLPEHCMDIAACILSEITNDIGKDIQTQEKVQDDRYRKEANEEFRREIEGERTTKPEE